MKEYNSQISTWQATAGAVSFGNEERGLTRQITVVAAGSADTDAVNVAQLKKLKEKVDINDFEKEKIRVNDAVMGKIDANGEITNTEERVVKGKVIHEHLEKNYISEDYFFINIFYYLIKDIKFYIGAELLYI